ncbi:hypothetical protein ACFL1B_01270 [Nanoarchaeota archaeon]
MKNLEFTQDNGIIGLMDGNGSNLETLNKKMPGVVKLIGTSNPKSKARKKANAWKVPLVEMDFSAFEKEKGVNKGDFLKVISGKKIHSKLTPQEVIQVRQEACSEFSALIKKALKDNGINKKIPVFAAGFMAILSEDFVNDWFILNVHPGDLTMDDGDKRILSGGAWVPSKKALLAGHGNLYTSMHLMTPDLDAGPVFMRGYALPVDYDKIELSNHEQLKKAAIAAQKALKYIGDHVVAGATFLDLFKGNWAMKDGKLFYKFKGKWQEVPDGIVIEEHVENNPDTPFKLDDAYVQKIIDGFYSTLLQE